MNFNVVFQGFIISTHVSEVVVFFKRLIVFVLTGVWFFLIQIYLFIPFFFKLVDTLWVCVCIQVSISDCHFFLFFFFHFELNV